MGLTGEERAYLFWLCHVNGVGAATIKDLYRSFGSFERIYNIEGRVLQEKDFFKGKTAEAFDRYKEKLKYCRKKWNQTQEEGTRLIFAFEEEYPERLKLLENSPAVLFVKGSLPSDHNPAVAIVGARDCTNYGYQAAEHISGQLSAAGISVISGLAYGIDQAAHWGALKAGCPTYGVLGCGINICYPRENYKLFEKVAEHGGIMTEYPPGEQPEAFHFPMRNRIISGLADVILVMEARKRSGSLITAELGLEQGKDVFALPGRVGDPLCEGCNQLIQDGAAPLLAAEDVLEYFSLRQDKIEPSEEKNHNRLAKTEKMVYSCLDLHPKCLEEIVELSGLSVSECINVLMNLELRGYIVQTSHQYYGKSNR